MLGYIVHLQLNHLVSIIINYAGTGWNHNYFPTTFYAAPKQVMDATNTKCCPQARCYQPNTKCCPQPRCYPTKHKMLPPSLVLPTKHKMLPPSKCMMSLSHYLPTSGSTRWASRHHCVINNNGQIQVIQLEMYNITRLLACNIVTLFLAL